jgi:hypothetical protein
MADPKTLAEFWAMVYPQFKFHLWLFYRNQSEFESKLKDLAYDQYDRNHRGDQDWLQLVITIVAWERYSEAFRACQIAEFKAWLLDEADAEMDRDMDIGYIIGPADKQYIEGPGMWADLEQTMTMKEVWGCG